MLRPGTQDTVISRRENMPTDKSHAELVRDVDPRIKAQAFFSARVSEAHILDRLREVSDGYSRGEFGLGEARNRLKDFLQAEGYDPHQGGMRNLASTGRLNLILKQNAAMAHAAAEWKRMHDPDAMKVYPYVRYHARGDNRTRSEHAHLDGRIFHKDDPFLSTHTPPWEFNCRCWLEEITEKEASKTPDLIQEPTPPEEVTVDSKSGFSFDPAHAFETFEFDAIKDPDLREKAKSGIEKILSEPGPTPSPVKEPEPVKEPNPIKEPEPVKDVTPINESERQAEDTKQPAPPLKFITPVSNDGQKSAVPAEMQETHEQHLARRQEQREKARENRVKREAKFLGADLIQGEHTRDQDLAAVNPNYGKGEEWDKNCQRVVYCYEARRRGIDVEAQSKILTGSDPMDGGHWKEVCRGMRWQQPKETTPQGTKLAIDKAMTGFGDGSRAVVYVVWDVPDPKAHVFIAENIGGKIVYVDPQNNDDNVDSNFWVASPEKTEFARLDNLKFSNYIKLCCKRRNP